MNLHRRFFQTLEDQTSLLIIYLFVVFNLTSHESI